MPLVVLKDQSLMSGAVNMSLTIRLLDYISNSDVKALLSWNMVATSCEQKTTRILRVLIPASILMRHTPRKIKGRAIQQEALNR